MKRAAYETLVADRKACRLCAPDLRNPSEWPDLDSQEIGPWSIWQGNLDAEIMLVGQDWGDDDFFTRNGGNEEGVYNPTNNTLAKLLASIGVGVEPPRADPGHGSLFFTNSILCLKAGGLQADVRSAWFKNCAPYLRRQIEIVQPRVVVALGEKASRAVCRSFGLRAAPRFRDAVEAPGSDTLPSGSLLVAVYHCGALGQVTRPLAVQLEDWRRIGARLSRECGLV